MGEIKHAVQRSLSVWGVTLVIGAVLWFGWLLYAGMIKPVVNPEATQNLSAQEMEVTYIYGSQEQFFLGAKLWGFKLGITKDKRVRESKPEIKNVD